MSDANPQQATTTVREAVGAFHTWKDLQAAVDALTARGFDRSDLSLLASEKAVGEKLGHVYEKVAELEDDAAVPRTAYVGKDSMVEAKTFAISGLGYVGALAAIGAIVASGGTLAAVIGGAAVAGGLGVGLGTYLTRAIGRERAESVQAQLKKGGLLLWVQTRDADHEARAVEILKAHGGDDVHLHDIQTLADPDADPLSGMQPDPFLPRARV